MLEKYKNIFIVGIKGVAMANLAIIFKKMGKSVSGSDVDEVFITDEILKENGINWTIGFDVGDVPTETDLVIFSAAHGGISNPQVKFADQRRITVIHQVKALNEIMKFHENRIAVCGSHGKTTTTAIIAYCLRKLGADPTFMIGTSKVEDFSGGDLGSSKYCVIEADEYGLNPPTDKTPKFQSLDPNFILSTNIDFDHPDVYADLEETKTAFNNFFLKIISLENGPRLFACGDNKELMEVISKFPRETYKTFGFSESSDYVIKNIEVGTERTGFDLYEKGRKIERFDISIFGDKNISNAAGAIAVLLRLGFKADAIKEVVVKFKGAKRRFEQTAFINNIHLLDDYAHHPREIEATINAARAKFSGNRVIIIFQPHTYSRTNALKEEFADSLSKADIAFITPVFASARESAEIQSVDVVSVAKDKGITNIFSYKDKNGLLGRLKEILKPGDVVFTMGAGDIYKLKNDIIKILE